MITILEISNRYVKNKKRITELKNAFSRLTSRLDTIKGRISKLEDRAEFMQVGQGKIKLPIDR